MQSKFIPCSMPLLIMPYPYTRIRMIIHNPITPNRPDDDESHLSIASQLTQRKSTAPSIV